jgi:hypothetical protein
MRFSDRVRAAHFMNYRELWQQILSVCSLLTSENHASCPLALGSRNARFDPRSIFRLISKGNSRGRYEIIEIGGIRGVEHENQNVAFSRC